MFIVTIFTRLYIHKHMGELIHMKCYDLQTARSALPCEKVTVSSPGLLTEDKMVLIGHG